MEILQVETNAIVRLMPFDPFFMRIKFHNKEICPRTFDKPCPLCEHYNYLWKCSQNIKDWKDNKKEIENEARKLKAIDRYYYHSVLRGREDEGIKIFSAGTSLHEIIIKGIVENHFPKLGLFERFWRWLFNRPYRWDVLDWNSGYDFEITKTDKNAGGRSFSDYSKSGFIKVKCPAGGRKHIKSWQKINPDFESLYNNKLKTYDELLSFV